MAVSLLCLVGLPGSGKTTLAVAIKNYFSGELGEAVCIEYDSYILEFTYSDGTWKKRRKQLLDRIEKTAKQLLIEGKKIVIILDDNFFYRSMRYEVYKLSKNLHLGFGQIFLDVPLATCLSRNNSRTNPLPSEVIVKMNSLMEPPEPSRNPWEKYSIAVGDVWTTGNLDVVHNLVATTWEHPCYREAPAQFPIQDNSAVHFADLALRQIVKSVIISAPSDERSILTQQLAQRKKTVLDDIKMKNIVLPEGSSEDDLVSLYIRFLKPHFISISLL